jgi:hypothetical protein
VAGGRAISFYDVLFALSGVLRLAAVAVFLPFIHEPTARTAGEALRFILVSLRCSVAAWLPQSARPADEYARAET